ncbi:hypothetical protein [Microbacterium aureliae]
MRFVSSLRSSLSDRVLCGRLRTGRPAARAVKDAYRRVRDDESVRDAAVVVRDDLRRAGGAARAAHELERLVRGGR